MTRPWKQTKKNLLIFSKWVMIGFEFTERWTKRSMLNEKLRTIGKFSTRKSNSKNSTGIVFTPKWHGICASGISVVFFRIQAENLGYHSHSLNFYQKNISDSKKKSKKRRHVSTDWVINVRIYTLTIVKCYELYLNRWEN